MLWRSTFIGFLNGSSASDDIVAEKCDVCCEDDCTDTCGFGLCDASLHRERGVTNMEAPLHPFSLLEFTGECGRGEITPPTSDLRSTAALDARSKDVKTDRSSRPDASGLPEPLVQLLLAAKS